MKRRRSASRLSLEGDLCLRDFMVDVLNRGGLGPIVERLRAEGRFVLPTAATEASALPPAAEVEDPVAARLGQQRIGKPAVVGEGMGEDETPPAAIDDRVRIARRSVWCGEGVVRFLPDR